MATKQLTKQEKIAKLILAPIEELIELGIDFDGSTQQDKVINQTDFFRIRNIFQRYGNNLTQDEHETLQRCLQSCLTAKFE